MKGKLFCVVASVVLFCTACGNGGGDSEVSTPLTVDEVQSALEKKSYENMDILFDKMENYNGQELVVGDTRIYDFSKDGQLTEREILELYADTVFPALLDSEEFNLDYLYDGNVEEREDGERYYSKTYAQVMDTLDEYDALPELLYQDRAAYSEFYYMNNWKAGVYISLGRLGSYAGSPSAFHAYGMIEDVKTYDCRTDDLSDSYMLMDGEKTVAEAKSEIEQYLNEHYPVGGIKNGITNVVWAITAGKIKGTEYYAFKAERTLAYNGIPFREMGGRSMSPEGEFLYMAICALCETGKVDVTIGPINHYREPEVQRTITEHIPFEEVLERVSLYLTGETKFQLVYGGLEYRLFWEQRDEGNDNVEYHMVPYWTFVAKDPNDDSMVKIYVDIETGEVEHG